jgi:hypothetical protein
VTESILCYSRSIMAIKPSIKESKRVTLDERLREHQKMCRGCEKKNLWSSVNQIPTYRTHIL